MRPARGDVCPAAAISAFGPMFLFSAGEIGSTKTCDRGRQNGKSQAAVVRLGTAMVCNGFHGRGSFGFFTLLPRKLAAYAACRHTQSVEAQLRRLTHCGMYKRQIAKAFALTSPDLLQFRPGWSTY